MRRFLVGVAIACAVTAACFADLDGFSGGDPEIPPESGAEGSTVDAPVDPPAGDGGIEGAPACDASLTIDNTMASDFAPFATSTRGISGYPKIAVIKGNTGAVLFPITFAPADAEAGTGEYVDAYSGLWITDVPLAAFDVDVDFLVDCMRGNGNCADGLMVAWLDALDAGVLANNDYGHISGLPKSTSGGGFIADTYQNDPPPDETGDPAPPTLQVIALDKNQDVGRYSWFTDHRTIDFRGSWHTLGLRVRGATVTVRYDNADLFTAPSTAVGRGLFGFTAGTGGKSDAVAIRNLHAKFYACTP